MLNAFDVAKPPSRGSLQHDPAGGAIQSLHSRLLRRQKWSAHTMSAAKAGSEVISKTDFGPAGFRWLTLSRIQVCFSLFWSCCKAAYTALHFGSPWSGL